VSATATLVVELVTEELPPKSLKALAEAFGDRLFNNLLRLHLHDVAMHDMTWFATPRRLAVSVKNVRSVAPDRPFAQKVLPANVAFDADGQPTPTLRSKLAALRLSDASSLKRTTDGKLEMLVYEGVAPGITLADGLRQALDDAIEKLPISKVMSYARRGGYYNDVKFVRPAHRLVALHGADIVPITALGLDAGRTTEGHRFLGRREIEIASADARRAAR
jgi:glycyl-tRNA synthetase beta chain